MDQITITLPEEMKGYIEGQVAGGKYATASDFFCELIRQEQQREAKRVVEGMLLESIESGPPVPLGAEEFEAMRAELRERSAKRAGKV